jgi:cytochrome c nitrite reductase small subunit
MSNDPKACMNCHVMREHHDSWVKSSHRKAATCNDCHTPHDFVGKWTNKALNGFNHSKAFTLQNYPEPIRITERNLKILEANCAHCHEGMTADTHAAHRDLKPGKFRCTVCHDSVGHMSLN